MRELLSALLGSGLAYGAVQALDRALLDGRLASALTLVVAGGVGLGVYVALCRVLRVPELRTVREMFRRPKNAPDTETSGGGAAVPME